MTKKFLKKLSLILIAALLVTSCPFSVFASGETELNKMTDAVETETSQDQLLETAEEAKDSIIYEEAMTENIIKIDTDETEAGDNATEEASTEDIIKIDTDESATDEETVMTVEAGISGLGEECVKSQEVIIKTITGLSENTPSEAASEEVIPAEATPAEATPAELTSDPVDGVIVTVIAPEDVFPKDSRLVVNKVPENSLDFEDIEAAVDNTRRVENVKNGDAADDRNGSDGYIFDIKVVDACGNEIQPAEDVQVRFALACSERPVTGAKVYHLEANDEEKTAEQKKILDDALNGTVYHGEEGETVLSEDELDGEVINDLEYADSKDPAVYVSDNDEADGFDAVIQNESEEGPDGAHLKGTSLYACRLETELVGESLQEITCETDGFSYYVVEFFYGTYEYVLDGDSEIELSVILDALHIDIDQDDITEVDISDSSLFTATESEGIWYITSLRAFDTQEWMKVHVGDVVYEIEVTDASTWTQISTEQGLIDAFSNNGEYILMGNITVTSDIEMPQNKNVKINLNGKNIVTNNSHILSIKKNSTVTFSGLGIFEMKINVKASGILNINGGTYSGRITINGTVSISDATLSETIVNKSDLAISGGYFVKVIYTGDVDDEPEAVTQVNGGIFESLPIVLNDDSKLNIQSGSFFRQDPTSLLEPQYKAVFDKSSKLFEVMVNTDLPLAKNNRTQTEYTDLQAAFNEAQNGDTIVLLNNVVYEQDNGPQVNGKNLTIDFDGYTFTGWLGVGYSSTSGNGGNVTIIGSSTDSPIIFEASNGGTLTFESGYFISNSYLDTMTEWSFITANAGSTVNINGGNFRGRICNNGGTLNLNSGSRLYGMIYNYGAGSNSYVTGATIEKGTFDTIVRSEGIGSALSVEGGNLTGAITLSRGSLDFFGGSYSGTVTQYTTTQLEISGGVFGKAGESTSGYAFVWADTTGVTSELSGGRYYCLTDAYTNTFPYTGWIKAGYHVEAVDTHWWEIFPDAYAAEAELYVGENLIDSGLLSRMLALATNSNCIVKIVAQDGVTATNSEYVVHDSARLDLNGKKLDVMGLNATDGYLEDSENVSETAFSSMGSIIINGGTFSVNASNGYLPLKDTVYLSRGATRGYRLFEYYTETTLGQTPDEGTSTYSYLRLQYNLEFANSNAYTLLAGGNSGLGISGWFRWKNADTDSNEQEYDLAFTGGTPEYVVQYGTNKPTQSQTVFYVNISGINNWTVAKKLQTRPKLTVDGVDAIFMRGDITKDALISVGGRAIYSTY